ncbi:hypothetical protein MYX82_05565 [Acidobacteria bacterium AH-259-D05]|nr:hypothetical protein [Acidobacteria bacterium AH-259-D05]
MNNTKSAREYREVLAKARKNMSHFPEEQTQLAEHLISLLANGKISEAIRFAEQLRGLLRLMGGELRELLETSAAAMSEIFRLRKRVSELEVLYCEENDGTPAGDVKETVH